MSVSPPVVPRRRRSLSAGHARWWQVLPFLAPLIGGLALFTLYPLAASLFYSFTNFQAGSLRPVRFVGLQNYQSLFSGSSSGLFWASVRNTLWMVLILVPVQTVWAMVLASLINRFKRSQKVYRTVFYLPALVPVVASALGFLVMLSPDGPVNAAFHALGVPMPHWFVDPAWSKPSMVLLRMWMIGNTMVIISAAMLDVPVQLYEAATLDGAGPIRRYVSVTLPGISPVIFFSAITGVIYTFQYFSEAFVISSAANPALSSTQLLGYPDNSLYFYATGIYQQGFGYFKTGVASAMAWLLFIVIFLVTLVFIRSSRRLIHYAGSN